MRLGSHDASQMHEYNMYLLRLESYESPALNGSLIWCFEHWNVTRIRNKILNVTVITK